MTMNLNKVQLIGRLGQAPEQKTTQSGEAVTNLSLAVTESWKDKVSQEWRDKTEWISVVCFGYNAEKAAKLQKGKLVYVEGKFQTRSWEDKDTGKKIYKTEVVLQKFQGDLKSLEKNEGNYQAPASDDLDDDMPF
jgi:single-strand DNA-binding protein